jgi:hypothetical protein
LKIAGVMRVGISIAELPDHRGDAFAFVAHKWVAVFIPRCIPVPAIFAICKSARDG